MLGGDLLRARVVRGVVKAQYLSLGDVEGMALAGLALELFAGFEGRSRGDLLEGVAAAAPRADRKLWDGFSDVLEKACEFRAVDGAKSQAMRQRLWEEGARHFPLGCVVSGTAPPETRAAVLERVGGEFGLSAAEIDAAMFGDLPSEQVLDVAPRWSPQQLVERYNLSLAQGILLHSVRLNLTFQDPSPVNVRKVLRYIKFFRLLFELDNSDANKPGITIEGPLSILESTKAYGMRMAGLLSLLLLVPGMELTASIRWKRRECEFRVVPEDGLVTHAKDSGSWIPQEFVALVERFRTLLGRDHVAPSNVIFPLTGPHAAVPDIRLSLPGSELFIEVVWPWQRKSFAFVDAVLEHAPAGYVLLLCEKAIGADVRERVAAMNDSRIMLYRATPPAEKVLKGRLG